MTQTIASQARATAPRAPMYYSPEEDKAAYRGHFAALGGVPSEVDTAGAWARARMRRCWVFPDGSHLVSDWA